MTAIHTLYVGIDIGAEKNMVQLMDEAGNALKRLCIANDLSGTNELMLELEQVASHEGIHALRVGMEATSLYWWHLYMALYENPALTSLDLKVAVINPKVVDGFKAVYVDKPKTDSIDAWVIADCLRFGRVRFTPPPDMRYAALQRLTRFRYHQAATMTQEKNRALTLVFLRFSNYAKDRPFSNVFGKASQAVLMDLTVDEVANATTEDLIDLIFSHGNNRLKDIPEMANQLKKAAKNAYRLHPDLQDSVAVTLAMSLDTIRFFEQQLKRLDESIARQVKATPNTLRTIPGIGPVYEAGLLAEIGDVHRFPDHNALAKYAGLTWRQHQSSGFAADDIPLTRSGNVYLRYYLIEAANSVRVREPEYRDFYQRKHDSAHHHHHKRALVLTARKLIRMVFALLNEGQIYQPRMVH